MKKKLDSVTLLGIDCIDIERLILAANICQENFEFADVKLLTSLPSLDDRIIKIDPITSIESYSKFVIADLDTYIDTSHLLMIQYDGFILNPTSWTDEFLTYDYIGAPWFEDEESVEKWKLPKSFIGTFTVGNGGFSLRSKKLTTLCTRLSKEEKFDTYHPEDMVLCIWKRHLLEEQGIVFAPVELAKKFSFESEYPGHTTWDGELGFHGLKWTDISRWLKDHPEYKLDSHNNLIFLP